MTERGYAKLNISLDVLQKRPDGYHDMYMIMQTVSLCDVLEVSLRSDGQLRCLSSFKYLPDDERNIAVKAARVFFAATGKTGAGADISIEKHIPICAGLGGGSADAAAVLRALNRLTDAGLTQRELEKLGEAVGSDVPFCVSGGTALAEGRGERLTALPPLPDCHVVICKPEFSISTPELFEKIDDRRSHCRPDTEGILAAIHSGDLPRVARRMYNVFEDVLPRQFGEIAVIKSRLLDMGALGVTMSGTGSAVFGLFDDEKKAACAKAGLAAIHRECFLARTVGRTPL